MTRKAFLRECRESQAASIRRYLVETTGLHRNMVNSVGSTTEAPANGKSRGYLAFLDLPASKSSWVPSREASGALSPLLATQRAPEPPGNKQTMPTPLPALATDFTHGKIYRHPYCKRALYRLIDARVTCPIQRAKTPDSLCYIICLVGKVLSLENTALPQFNVAASPHPTWLYKSWRMFAGKLR